MRQVLSFLWKQQISAIPPEALPYMTGEYIMNTDRLRRFLGPGIRARAALHDHGCVRG